MRKGLFLILYCIGLVINAQDLFHAAIVKDTVFVNPYAETVGLEIDSISCTNLDQTMNQNTAITNIVCSCYYTDQVIPYDSINWQYILTLPTGITASLDGNNFMNNPPTFSGTPTSVDTTYVVIRATAKGESVYTGVIDKVIPFRVQDPPSTPITALAYTNDDQTTTEGTQGSAMDSSPTPGGATGTYSISAGTLPSFLTLNTSTGEITWNTNGTEGSYSWTVQIVGNGSYTGTQTEAMTLTVNAASPTTYLVNFGAAQVPNNSNDPLGRYWNDLTTANSTISDIVDTDNNTSTIDVTTSGFAGNLTAGRNASDYHNYSSEAWRGTLRVTSGTGVVTISGLDNGATYTIKIGYSLALPGRDSEYTVASETPFVVQGNDDPPQDPDTEELTGISPTSNEIDIDVNIDSINAGINFLVLIEE